MTDLTAQHIHIFLDIPIAQWTKALHHILYQIMPDDTCILYDITHNKKDIKTFHTMQKSQKICIVITTESNLDNHSVSTKTHHTSHYTHYAHPYPIILLANARNTSDNTKSPDSLNTPHNTPSTANTEILTDTLNASTFTDTHFLLIHLDLPIKLKAIIHSLKQCLEYCQQIPTPIFKHYTLHHKIPSLTHINGTQIPLTKTETIIINHLAHCDTHKSTLNSLAHIIWPERHHYERTTLLQYLRTLRQKIHHMHQKSTTTDLQTPQLSLLIEAQNESVELQCQ